MLHVQTSVESETYTRLIKDLLSYCRCSHHGFHLQFKLLSDVQLISKGYETKQHSAFHPRNFIVFLMFQHGKKLHVFV